MIVQDAFLALKLPSAMKLEIEQIASKIGVSTSKYVRARLIPAINWDRVKILGRSG